MGNVALRYNRLEPRPGERDLQTGIAAVAHDPLWFLSRQWEMGELQGENASSPVLVSSVLGSTSILAADPRFDAQILPAEAIVESELDDWWTMGRRVRLGRRLTALAEQAEIDFGTVALRNPPPPFEHFEGAPDGMRLWKLLADGGADLSPYAGPPVESTPAWNQERLFYEQVPDQSFKAGDHLLTVRRHHGGRLDWYSVDASASGEPGEQSTAEANALPTPLDYPGAPNSRWWEFENTEVDPGLFVPDSAHSVTAMLTELIFSHGDDWLLFPALAHAGKQVSIESLVVRDAFDRTYESADLLEDGTPRWPGLHPPVDWSLLQVQGLPANSLLLWNVAELPLESLPIERVQFGPDEESNLVWAVERVIAGREIGHEDPEPAPAAELLFNSGTPTGDTSKPREFAYVAGRGIARFWHPYLLPEEGEAHYLIQHLLPDLSRQAPVPMPRPVAEVLQPANGAPVHRIERRAVPSNGIEVQRRWQLARDLNGNPVLWIQRSRQPSLAAPARRLRFDVMEEALEPVPSG
jgi:hypothetical protein